MDYPFHICQRSYLTNCFYFTGRFIISEYDSKIVFICLFEFLTILGYGICFWPRGLGDVHWPQIWDLPKIPSHGQRGIESLMR